MRGAVAPLTLVLAAVAPALAAPPTPASDEAHAGCVRTDLRACMISLGSAFWFDMSRATAQIARRNELDVNGNTAHRKITLDMKLPLHAEMIGVTLTLASPAPNDQVVKVEIDLPEDPETAHTQSEYDRTDLYNIVSVVLGARCPGLDRLALYRFYENTLKPHEVVKTQVYHEHGVIQTLQTIDAGGAPFCNATFSLHRATAWYGPPDAPTRPLPSRGGFAASTITIE